MLGCSIFRVGAATALVLLLSIVHAVSSSSEAIVVLSDVMTWECEIPRLEALVRSAGPDRDVWYLFGPSTADIAAEMDRKIRGLHVAPRPNVADLGGNVKSFAGQRSKGTTTAFLLWLSRSLYTHAWYVEIDTFYTGQWSNVFDPFAYADGPDVVTRLIPNVGPNWYFWKSCELDGEACSSIAPIMTTWFIIRISRRLGEKIIISLMTGSGKGHHEALTLSVCSKQGWKYADISSGGVRGELNAGGYLDWKVNDHKNMTLSYYNVKPFMLYHPIKCTADQDLGHKALMWMRQGISVTEKILRSSRDTPPEMPRGGADRNTTRSNPHAPLAIKKKGTPRGTLPESRDRPTRKFGNPSARKKYSLFGKNN